jgi:hypothetical protein
MPISIYKLNAEMPAFMLSFPLFDPVCLCTVAPRMYCTQCCGAGAEINPEHGAEIMNCGSGSASFLFIKDLKKKIIFAEEVFVNCSNFNPIRMKTCISPRKKFQ